MVAADQLGAGDFWNIGKSLMVYYLIEVLPVLGQTTRPDFLCFRVAVL